jgi:hypothetical protein
MLFELCTRVISSLASPLDREILHSTPCPQAAAEFGPSKRPLMHRARAVVPHCLVASRTIGTGAAGQQVRPPNAQNGGLVPIVMW